VMEVNSDVRTGVPEIACCTLFGARWSATYLSRTSHGSRELLSTKLSQ
jgi:hypothetical protein